jgi:Fe-S cluster biogenesis protein NfuA
MAQVELEELNKLIDQLRPAVQADGGDLELVSADVDQGIVAIELKGACASCAISTTTIKAGVERILKAKLPWVREVVGQVDETMDSALSASLGKGNYVPLIKPRLGRER